MASYSPKLLEKKYHNWVKAGLAVLFTREGIEPFVSDEIQQFLLECLDDICYNNGLMDGTTCSNCCTENVVACPTRGICNINRGQCKYHKDFTTQYNPSGCPSKLCNNFKNKIQSVHRFNGPSYRNSDATQWCSNPWEVAKCFMPPDGYKDVTCATETDFNGINSVIINHKVFQLKVHDNLSNMSNIFEKARVIGKDVRHSSSLQVDDTSLTQYFTDLQLLLSDTGYLNTNTHAQNAKLKISQLQNDTLVIGKEEVHKVLDDVAKAVQDKIRTEIDEQEMEAEKQKHELLKASHTALDSLKHKEKVSVAELNNALSSALHQLEEKTEQSLKRLENKTNDLAKTLETKTDVGVEKIKGKTDGSVNTLETKTEEGVKKINDTTDNFVKTLKTKTDDGVEKINSKTDSSVKTLETKTEEGVEKINDTADDSVKMLETKTEGAVEKISNKTDDSVKTLEVKSEEGVEKINQKTKDFAKTLETKTEEGVEKISNKTVDLVKTLETKKVDGVKKIHDNTDGSVKTIETKTGEGVDTISKKTDDSVRTIETKTEEEVEKIKYCASIADRHKKEDLYNNLREDLIQHYREQYSTLPVTPLLDGIIDVPLLEMYVPPFPMVSVETDNLKLISMPKREEPNMEGVRGKDRTRIDETKELKCKSLSDVFCKNKKTCKNIYVTAEPGFGKSSFVKWLVLTWCQARNPSADLAECFSYTDLQQMREFEFVFLVLLRDTQPEETHVDKMIANHLISLLGRQSLYTMADVEEALSTTKSLIILDGLDEWSSSNDPSAIPKRAARPSCSYITTSRPWKMATVSVRSSQIDQHVQIKDLQRICTDKILPKSFNIFRKNNCLRSDCLDVTETDTWLGLMDMYSHKLPTDEDLDMLILNKFTLSTEERSFLQMLKKKKIKQFAASPVMLLQILYLWNFDKTVGNSQCQIYSNIVDALLARAAEKGTVPSLSKYKTSFTCTFSYFDNEAYNCNTYYKLLLELGNVAFQTLFSYQKESSLVFQKKYINQYIQTEDIDEFLDTVVKVGLLSQEMHMTPRRKEYSYSFYHKTIQEYFAALYIQSNHGDNHVIEKILTRCNTVSSILEMGTVFMFLSGFNPQIACEVLQNLQSTIHDDQEMEQSRSRSFDDNVQRMILSCVQECRSNGHELLVSDTNKNAIQFPLCDIVIDHYFQTEFCCTDMEYIIKCNGSRIKSVFIGSYDDTEGTGLTESLTYSNVECLQYLRVRDCKELPSLLSSLDRLVHLKYIYLETIDLGERLVLGPGMKHIEYVILSSLEITNTAFHMLVGTVLTCAHSVTVVLYNVTVNDRTVVKQEETVKNDISTLPTFRRERSDHGRKMFKCTFVTITARTLQEFVYTVEKCQQPVEVRLYVINPLKPDTEHASKNDDEIPHTNDDQDSSDAEGHQKVKEYIRSSSSFNVQEEDLYGNVTFMTNYEPENSDNDTSDESDY